MIIDFHTHIFPHKIAKSTLDHLEKLSDGKANTDGTYEGLIRDMVKSGVDISVALPVVTKPSQFDSISRFAIEINKFSEENGKRIISFSGIHPKCEDIKGKMKFLKENGILGVKIHPDYQDTFIDDDGYLEILKSAKDLDMIVVTHSGVDNGFLGQPIKCPPELAKKVLRKIGHDKFVLAHYGAFKQWEEVYTTLAGENVYFDTAFTFPFIEEQTFIKILEKHGEDKILFATDSPWDDVKSDLDIFSKYNISTDVKEKILYKNALKLLNL